MALYHLLRSDPYAFIKGLMRRFGAGPLPFVIVPNHYVAQTLSEAFLSATEGTAARMLRFIPLAQVDDLSEITRARLWAAEQPDYPFGLAERDLQPPIDSERRLLLLTQQILIWCDRQPFFEQQESATRLGGAFGFSRELVGLMDRMEENLLDWEALKTVKADRLGRQWHNTLALLEIIATHWPNILDEARLSSPLGHLQTSLHLLGRFWTHHPPRRALIVLLCCGTAPLWDPLLLLAERFGAVVMADGGPPQDPAWIAAALKDPTSRSHSLVRLWQRLQWQDRPTEPWDAASPAPAEERSRLLEEAFRPANLPPAAATGAVNLGRLLRYDVGEIEEEALLISLILRHGLERKGAKLALITPNHALGQRVETLLAGAGLAVHNSHGRPLLKTLAGSFLGLLGEAAVHRFDWPQLQQLCFHPFFGGGNHDRLSRLWRRMEKEVIRPALQKETFTWRTLVDGAAVGGAALEREENPQACLARLAAGFKPLQDQEGRLNPPQIWTKIFLQSLQILCDDGTLWHHEDGLQLAVFLENMADKTEGFPPLDLVQYLSFLEARSLDFTVRRAVGLDPRIGIYGLAESRMGDFDTVVLGGLNEDSFPATSVTATWLNRTMTLQLGLPPAEYDVGLGSWDVFSALQKSRCVFLTRSRYINGTLSQPSRWLLQMESALKRNGLRPAQSADFEDVPDFSALLENAQAAAATPPAQRAAADPAAGRRRRHFSPTSISLLFRDPYAYYARYILGLKALDSLSPSLEANMFGLLLHTSLEEHFRENPGPLADKEAFTAVLSERIDGKLRKLPLEGMDAASWKQRAATAVEQIFEIDSARLRMLREVGWIFQERFVEVEGRSEAAGLTFEARFDRVDLFRRDRCDGVLLVDYKTGLSHKTAAEFLSPKEPQATIGAWLFHRGGLPDPRKNAGPSRFDGFKDAEFLGFSYFYVEKKEAEKQEKFFSPRELQTLSQDFDTYGVAFLAQSLQGPYAAYRNPKDPLRNKKTLYRDDMAQLSRWYEWFTPKASAD